MNAGRLEEIEAVAAQLFAKGEYVPAAMLRELMAAIKQTQAKAQRLEDALIQHLQEQLAK